MEGDDVATYAELGLQTQSVRKNSSVVALRTTVRRRDDALQMRNVVMGLGWDWHIGPSSPFGFELLAEMGAGGSAVPEFSGIGMYAGGAAVPRLRLLGHEDRKPGYALVMSSVDLVLTPRLGIWLPPEGSASVRPYVEGALEIGLRLNLASDLLNGASQSTNVDPPPERRKR
jgi:hypothetical protein